MSVNSSLIIMKQDWCILFFFPFFLSFFLSFFLVGDVDSAIQAKQAQADGQEFIEMIFSTSVQRIGFDSYKDRAAWREDVARASGHCNLARYLEDITTR